MSAPPTSQVEQAVDTPVPPGVEICFTYEPTTCLEQALALEHAGWQVRLDSGTAVAWRGGVHDDLRALEEHARGLVTRAVQAAQLVEKAAFSVSPCAGIVVHTADGGKGTVILASTGALVLKGHRADLAITGPDGVRVDTRRDRVSRKHRLAAALVRVGDELALHRMLRSFEVAMRTPADELVHLFEIWETFETAVAGTNRDLYQANRARGQRLGRMANGMPLTQGRHRGQHFQQLRDATVQELGEAREIAVSLIEAYAAQLDAARLPEGTSEATAAAPKAPFRGAPARS